MERLNVKKTILLDLITRGAWPPALEKLKGDHNFSEDELNRSLVLACQCGQTCLLRKLVGRGANVNYRDANGNTPLMFAVQKDSTDMVKFLLQNKADVNACNSVNDSALILSIHSSESTEITEYLLKQAGINIDHQNQDGYTAIMKAAEVKNTDTLKILLEKYFEIDSSKMSASVYESVYESTEEHKTYEQISDSVPDNCFKWTTLVQTFNCKGENLYQIAKRCGVRNVFLLLQEHVVTKISPLKLAMRASDIQSFLVFLDCDFISTTSKKKYLNDELKHIFQTCSSKDVIDFNEHKIAMIQALLGHGADVNTTWCSKPPVVNKEYPESIRVTKFFARFNPPQKPLYCLNQINPIHIAAKSGCLKVLELLLSFKADINRNSFLDSPLHVTLSHNHTECAKLLIQHGADISYNQALKLAVDHQETKYVKFLIENYKSEIMKHLKKIEINNILITSVRKGSLEIIDMLLDLGANINVIVSADSETCPLVESKNGEVAKFLIGKGASVKYVKYMTFYHHCISPLIQVINNRDRKDKSVVEVIKVLLDNGASGKDDNGITPLMFAAAYKGNKRVLQLLLDHGAKPSEVDKSGNTALMHAVWQGCSQNISVLLQAMKDRKELLNLHNGDGVTPLMYASRFRNTAVIEVLIDQGADVNVRDRQGNTALLHLLETADCHKDAAIKSLIQAGCDVNWQNNYGLSPLMAAARNCVKDTLCVLLDSGADVNAVSKTDATKTALSHLLCRVYNDDKHFSCLECLLDRGASVSNLGASVCDKLILAGRTQVILKLIQCGLGPVNYQMNDMHVINLSPRVFDTLSPSANEKFYYSALHAALCVGNKDLAQFFVDNLLLTHYDIYLLGRNKLLREELERKKDSECLDFLDMISAQPMSLFNLCFVRVTMAVGAGPGREIRINKLPVPQIIIDKLLFKRQNVVLSVPETDITTMNGSQMSSSYDEYDSDNSYTDYDIDTEDDQQSD